MEAKNTFVDIELENGETVKATLTFYYLLKLKNMNRGLYERYNKVMTKGPQDEFDNITLLYAAYMCAQIAEGTDEDAMDEEEFLSVLSPDREYMAQLLQLLVNPKKARASAARS